VFQTYNITQKHLFFIVT